MSLVPDVLVPDELLPDEPVPDVVPDSGVDDGAGVSAGCLVWEAEWPVTAFTTEPIASLTTSIGPVGLSAGSVMLPGTDGDPLCPSAEFCGAWVTPTRGRTVLALMSRAEPGSTVGAAVCGADTSTTEGAAAGS